MTSIGIGGRNAAADHLGTLLRKCESARAGGGSRVNSLSMARKCQRHAPVVLDTMIESDRRSDGVVRTSDLSRSVGAN